VADGREPLGGGRSLSPGSQQLQPQPGPQGVCGCVRLRAVMVKEVAPLTEALLPWGYLGNATMRQSNTIATQRLHTVAHPCALCSVILQGGVHTRMP